MKKPPLKKQQPTPSLVWNKETHIHTTSTNTHTHTHWENEPKKKKTPKQGPVTPRSSDLDPRRHADRRNCGRQESRKWGRNSSRAASCKKIKRKLQWSASSVRWWERAGQNTVREETGNLVGGPKVLVRERKSQREREREDRGRERERTKREQAGERAREEGFAMRTSGNASALYGHFWL